MRDSFGNISYFIYELDYGREYQEGCVSDKNGNIDISTPEKLLKLLEDGEKVIGEKRVEFFEKEEGHLYEKIGEGIYQRKR